MLNFTIKICVDVDDVDNDISSAYEILNQALTSFKHTEFGKVDACMHLGNIEYDAETVKLLLKNGIELQ